MNLKIENDEIQIDMSKNMFKGNTLDIGFENMGVVYNIYKHFNDNIDLDYIYGKEQKYNIKTNFYDACVLFFVINNMWSKVSKGKLIEDIYEYLNEDGVIYLWDIDKGVNKIFNKKIKIIMPGNIEKKMHLKDFNIFKNNSKSFTMNIIKKYFYVVDEKELMGVYFIKAKKK